MLIEGSNLDINSCLHLKKQSGLIVCFLFLGSSLSPKVAHYPG